MALTQAVRDKRCKDKRKTDPLRYAAQLSRQNEWAKKRRADPKTWAAANLRTLKVRAKQKGFACDIAAADIVPGETCPLCQRTFVFGSNGSSCSPSVDKRLPALGYVRNNVRVICRRCNMCKSDATDPKVFERIAAYLRGEL